MTTELGEYLKAATHKKWQPGYHDCSAWPARWAGIKIPYYKTDDEGQAIINSFGSLLAAWQHWIGDRLVRVDDPHPGDVGIIEALSASYEPVQVGAIYTGRRWAFLSHRGMVCASANPLAVWRV